MRNVTRPPQGWRPLSHWREIIRQGKHGSGFWFGVWQETQKPAFLSSDHQFLLDANLNPDLVDLAFIPFPIGIQDTTSHFYLITRGFLEHGSARQVYLPAEPWWWDLNDIALGYTLHLARGSWSSYPLHSFEVELLCQGGKAVMQEEFLYYLHPRDGKALQGTFTSGQVMFHTVGHGDRQEIPLGPHPLVAFPGVRAAYLWIIYHGQRKVMELATEREAMIDGLRGA